MLDESRNLISRWEFAASMAEIHLQYIFATV